MLSSPTIPGKTINELLEHWASRPKKSLPAFVSFGQDGKRRYLTRTEVYRLSSAFAYRLSSVFGVVSGDVVCISLPNCLERIICDMGVLLAGATSMNGQVSQADGQDFINSLKTSKAKFVIIDPNTKNSAWRFLKDIIHEDSGLVRCDSLLHLSQVIKCQRDDMAASNDFITQLKQSNNSVNVAVSPSSVATVMTTSGSTGFSKLVPFTHANLCHFFLQVKAIEPLKEGDHFINCAPLGWAGGYPQWYLGCGVTRYFVDMYDGPPPDMANFVWNIIVSEKIVYAFMSPVSVIAILNNSSLWENAEWKPKVLVLAGQPINQGHLQVIGKLCQAVDINYGMTECNLVSTHRITDVSCFENGCAGYPGFGVQVKVVDKDNQEVSNGTTGEIILQSPALMPGYLNNDPANKAAFTADGWFSTNDAGYVDPKTGKLHIEGRQSDCIMRGAYVFYPSWLENIIRKVEGVKDVVVVPVPDKVLHNEICACVLVDAPIRQAVAGTNKLKKDSMKKCMTDDHDSGSRQLHSNGPSCRSTTLMSRERKYKKMKSDDLDQIDYSTCSVSKKGGDFFLNGLTIGSSNATSSKELEGIRKSGMKKTLNVTYNQTSVKSDFIKSGDHIPSDGPEGMSRLDDESDSSQYALLKLEADIRKHCFNSQLLHAKDDMRMEPHYYVFFDKFALTNTGKISRPDTCKLAISALAVD